MSDGEAGGCAATGRPVTGAAAPTGRLTGATGAARSVRTPGSVPDTIPFRIGSPHCTKRRHGFRWTHHPPFATPLP
jgi:hypothetical protein